MAAVSMNSSAPHAFQGLPTRPPGECKVLVVDDDIRIVEIFSLLLQQQLLLLNTFEALQFHHK